MTRLDVLRDLLTRSVPPAYADPLQKPHLYCAGLETHPWWSAERFAWVAALESEAGVIREELLRSMETFRTHPGDYRELRFDAGEWSGVYFSFHGRRFEETRRACPRTAELVDAIPRSTGINFFSKISPGTHIVPHFGLTNLKLRCHLGLLVPEGCSMRVGEEWRSWEEGRCLVFDDSFEHEVWHRGTGPRVVLSVDFGHPDLTDEEFRFLKLAEESRDHAFTEHVDFWEELFDHARAPHGTQP